MPRSSSSRTQRTPRPKSRNWCFTLNNYAEMELDKIKDFHKSHPETYIIYGKETGDEGTPHLQGYVHLMTPQALSYIKKIVPRAHIEKCKGTPAENIEYCKKDGNTTEFGSQPMTQQEKNKLKQATLLEYAKNGELAKIEEEFPGQYLNQYRNIHQIMTDNMVKPPDLEATCGVWIMGKTGCGKTTKARTEYGTYYSKPCNKWWDGYQNEDCVIIEDMAPNHSKLSYHLKLWADKWSFLGEIKGGTRQLRPKKVIVTSQYSPFEVFKEEGEKEVEAIERRFEIIDMDLPPTEPQVTPELHDYEEALQGEEED